jgi:subtilisin family serine protease
VLKSVIVPGYDFTRGEAGPGSEMADVNQSTAAVVDGTPVRVNGTTFAVVNQSTAAVVDGGGHSAFGHGTMVAGIIHLVAPRATIMSLKAFGSNGFGYTSDVVRAMYYAVRSNASAINMSFSIPESSRELARAVTFAVNRGVICVASAGNSGTTSVVYPAGFNKVMAIASTDINDKRSSFSNYGEKYIWVAAPGEGVITTYPFGTYAAGWGTSFSTPFVTGTAALLMDIEPNSNQVTAAKRIAHAKQLERDLGNGRLDVVRALKSAAARE